MSESQANAVDGEQQQQQQQSSDMIAHVMAMEAALLSCLPARELQAIDRSAHPSHQIDVERHARDFMEAAKKLHLYFLSLQREKRPTKADLLQKEVAAMEEELKMKIELIDKQERLVTRWKVELKNQADKHNTELERTFATSCMADGSDECLFVGTSAITHLTAPMNSSGLTPSMYQELLTAIKNAKKKLHRIAQIADMAEMCLV